MLLRVVQDASDLSSLSDELAGAARTWPETYHLSRSRANVLRGLDLPTTTRVLEVGAGCGAVTRYLGETCAVVDALEPMPERAQVARARTRDLSSVEVFVGGTDDLPREPTYDLVVVVGVLEYVGDGLPAEEPYLRFLASIAGVLREGGTLVLAIENKLGVKYLAGSPEDHSNKVFHGVEDYPVPGPARTFSREALTRLMSATGLQSRFLGAFPDYKLPRAVMSAELLSSRSPLSWRLPRFPSPDWTTPRPRMASEGLLWRELVAAGVGADFANSHIVLASKGVPSPALWPEGQQAAFFSTEHRAARYCTASRVVHHDGDVTVQRSGLLDASRNAQEMVRHEAVFEMLVRGDDLIEVLSRAANEELIRLLRAWVALLPANDPDHAPAHIDLIPTNLVVTPVGELVAIDQEWLVAGYTRQDVVDRGLLVTGLELATRTPASRWPVATCGQLVEHLAGMVVGKVAEGWLDRLLAKEARLQVAVTSGSSTLHTDAEESASAGWLRARLDTPLAAMELGTRVHELLATAEQQAEAASEALQNVTRERDAQAEELRQLEAQVEQRAREAAQRQEQIDRLTEQVRALERAVDVTHSSTSWRVTAPLRAASEVARRRRAN